MSSSSYSIFHDGGVGTLRDPGRVVHNLPNIGLDGGGVDHDLQRGMFNSALPLSASGMLLSTPSPTHAISCDPPTVVGNVENVTPAPSHNIKDPDAFTVGFTGIF